MSEARASEPSFARRRAMRGIAGLRRAAGLAAVALAVFAAVLMVFGKDPFKAYVDVISSTLGSRYGLSETVVKMIPLLLTAVAVAVPGRVCLINVGGEGQLFIGALSATWVALGLHGQSAWIVLPCMAAMGFAGGGLWAALAGWLRARGWVS